MNVWKSPLLLFGIAVILMAGGALFAPYFIDWGNYRSEIEKYGRQMTGRQTQVVGDVSVRLFPWPRVKIKDVRIANPPGAKVTELFRADEIDIRLRLAPLLSGKLEVEGIEINRPIIGLERLASGEGTWILQPKPEANNLFDAEDVALSGISITNGTIVLADGQRGGEAQLDGFNAFVSARSLNGPWKLRGEAVVNDQGIEIALNTGKWRMGQPLKFGLRLSSVDEAGLAYSFDGQSSTGEKHEITGKLKVVPTAGKNGKSEIQANFRPLVFRSDITADFDSVKFSKIEVAPKNAVDVQTFLTGKATVRLGSILHVDAVMEGRRFDVDSVLGNQGRKTLRSINSLDAIAGLVENLPKNVHLHTVVDLKTLVMAGQSFDRARVDLDVAESTLKINNLSATLPGRTWLTFKGGLLAGEQQAQLIGDLGLDMISLKSFTKWAVASYKREIDHKWSGARGRLQLAAKIDLSRDHFRLRDGVFSLDGAKGKVGFSLTEGKDPAISAHIVSDVLNIDRYAPEGLLSEEGKANLSGLVIDALATLVGERDLDISTKTGLLVMNGVEARDVDVDFNANENSVDFRRFKLGSVGGSSMDLSGVVKFSGDDVTGLLDGTINAADPAKLFRLFSAREPSENWLRSVSPLNIKVSGEAAAGELKSSGKLKLSGMVGKTTVSGKGQFEGKASEWQKARLHLSGQLSGGSAKGLLAVFGVEVERGGDGAGKFAITAAGNLDDGLATSANFDAYGVAAQFSGRLASRDGSPKAQGRLAVLVENTDQLFEVLGVHPGDASPIGKVFSAEGVMDANSRVLDLKKIRGTAVGTSFGGTLNLVFGSDQPMLKMEMEAGRLSLPSILGTALLGRDGNIHTAATRFSPQAMAGIKTRIKFKTEKLEYWPGFDVHKATMSLDADEGTVKLAAAGIRSSGQPVKLELSATVADQLTRVSGKVDSAIKLERLLQTSNARAVIEGIAKVEGEFAGSGRTPGGLLAGLSGSGSYQISDGIVRHISPTQFAKNLPAAETAKDIEAMIANSLRAGDMKFGDGKGRIKLENGVANFMPLAINGAGASGSLKVMYELARGQADVSIRLKLAEPANVPGFEVAYAGSPASLAPSSNFTALKSHLTVAALNRTLDKLEALEEEQRRLVEEEKKARVEAAEKRKAQQEKQRLLREKQRKLLEEATTAKEQAATKAREESQRKTAISPPVVTPLPKPTVRTPVPTTRLTVTPQVIPEQIPPLAPNAPPNLFVPQTGAEQKSTRPVGNWQSSPEVDGRR